MAGRPTSPNPSRPLSPHLSIWKWQVHAIASITHRITGNAMALGAVVLFLWWLLAAATGPAAYAIFLAVATGWFGILVGIGFTWVFFQHLCSGVRHLIMDTGQGYGLPISRATAALTFAVSILLTIVTWAVIYFHKGF